MTQLRLQQGLGWIVDYILAVEGQRLTRALEDPLHEKDPLPLLETEFLASLLSRRHQPGIHEPARGGEPLVLHLLLEIGDEEDAAVDLGPDDEGAPAPLPSHQPLFGEHGDGPPHRHAAEVEPLAQVRLGGQAVAGAEFAVHYPAVQDARKLKVGGGEILLVYTFPESVHNPSTLRFQTISVSMFAYLSIHLYFFLQPESSPLWQRKEHIYWRV